MSSLVHTQGSRWEQRILRAAALEKAHPCAAEILRFYQQVAVFQDSLYEFLSSHRYQATPAPQSPCPEELDTFTLLPSFQRWLQLLKTIAPPAMARTASDLAARPRQEWEELLSSCWREARRMMAEPRLEFLIALPFLQPVAEYLADKFSVDPNLYSGATCPFCGAPPAVGALRPEGDGGKRFLICCLCATEWQYRRIVCPACGEEDVYKLSVYTSEEFPQVRVEACETCKAFLKTVDLTTNGKADPLVDELASIPLTLWARQAGYSKIQYNMTGE